ncbi:hypothetical protein LSAT2_005667, partial [Lamellibrachia satsuma]
MTSASHPLTNVAVNTDLYVYKVLSMTLHRYVYKQLGDVVKLARNKEVLLSRRLSTSTFDGSRSTPVTKDRRLGA